MTVGVVPEALVEKKWEKCTSIIMIVIEVTFEEIVALWAHHGNRKLI